MLLFLSGNFPSLSNLVEEQKLKDKIEKYGSTYKRLLTFFYQKEAEIGIQINRRNRRLKSKKPKTS